MTELVGKNLAASERILRAIIGIALIAAGAGYSDAEHWVALFAVYPVVTAIIGWDPAYAVYLAARKRFVFHAHLQAKAP